jgi:hypothetical protein
MAAFRRFEALREAVFTVVVPAILRVRSLGFGGRSAAFDFVDLV